MKHTKSREIVEFVGPTVSDVNDVMGVNPSCLITSFTVLMDMGALALVSEDDGVFRGGRDGLSFRQ